VTIVNLYGLFVDDTRDVPTDYYKICGNWTVVYDYFTAVEFLQKYKYDFLSLDHDLASFSPDGREWTGYDICLWLAEQKTFGLWIPPIIKVHSANPVGSTRMRGVIERYLIS
jgi:hypothetical protein